MSHDEVLAALLERFPDAGIERLEAMDFTVAVAPASLQDVAAHLRSNFGFDFLSAVSGADWPDRFEVVYHLYSTRQWGPPLVLKVRLGDRDNPRVASLVGVWESANLQEREAYDMFGIVFEGHPQLERLFMWEGFPGYPLRKDFVNRLYTFEEMRQTLPPEGER